MELKAAAGFWTDHAKDTLFAPALSKLTRCGASELPVDLAVSDHWLSDFILNTTFRFPLDDPARQLAFSFLRQVDTAVHAFERGRLELEEYIAQARPTRLTRYSRALAHFETCLAATWLSWSLVRRLVPNAPQLFEPGDDSDLERIYKLHNAAKHSDGHLASGRYRKGSTLHLWITNEGLLVLRRNSPLVSLADYWLSYIGWQRPCQARHLGMQPNMQMQLSSALVVRLRRIRARS